MGRKVTVENMKKIISCLLAGIMLAMSLPVFAAVDTNYTVYNLNFDGGDTSAIRSNGSTVSSVEGGIDGSKAVYIEGYGSEEDVASINLKYLNRTAYSQISVYVKPVTENISAKVKLVVTLNEGGTAKQYTLDEKEIAKGSWVKLSNTLHTKYRALLEEPKVSVIVTDSNGVCSYMIDNFVVTSDKPSTENYQEVQEINNNGNYVYRAAFETDTIESFKYDAYTVQIPEYYCTDEIPAHTGRQSCLVTGRGAFDSTVTIMLPGVDKKSKIEISCYVYNGPGVLQETYYIRDWFTTKAGLQCHQLSTKVTAQSGEWVKLSATVDLSAYEFTATPGFQIMTDIDKIGPFYVDDIVVTSDRPGTSYDDMDYKEPERGEELSDTAYRYVPKNIPVQTDIPSLKDVYKDYFKIGMALQEKAIGARGNRYFDLILKHCNQLTGEGSYKTSTILKNSPTGKVYNFTTGNKLAEFATQNGMEIVGHVLTWESPSYNIMTTDVNGKFLSRDEILAFMKGHIAKVMRHFEGDGDASEYEGITTDYKNWHCAVWDVVNEAAFGTTADGFSSRGSGLRAIVGQDWVRYAFDYAEAVGYDDIELRYNDFGEQNEDKLNGIYTVAKHIIDGGCKLDIIGMQSHYNPDTTIASVRRAMERLSSLGTKIDITELDIRVYTDAMIQAKKDVYTTGVPKDVEFYQANLWFDLFQLYKEYSDRIDRVTMWSITDKLSSVNESQGFDRIDYGNIFDRNMQAKPQYWAIADPEYYLKEILKEDNSKLRISVNSDITGFEEESYFEENGVIYIDANALLGKFKDLKYVINGGRVSVIRNSTYYEINANTATANFKDYKLRAPVINRDGKVYVSYEEMCEMLGYGSSYSEQRNLINVSEYAHGAILDETNQEVTLQ